MPVSRASTASGTWSSTCSRSTRHRSSASTAPTSRCPRGPRGRVGGGTGWRGSSRPVGRRPRRCGPSRGRLRRWPACRRPPPVRVRPTEPGPVLPSRGDTGVHPLHDQLAFVLGEGGEHVQHQPPGRGRRVDAVGDRPHRHVAVAEQVDGVEDVDQRPAEPVDPPHHHHVAGLGVGEQPLHTGPLCGRLAAGCDVGEHVPLLHPRGDQRVELQPRVLARPC